MSTPRSIRSRASPLNRTSFAAMSLYLLRGFPLGSGALDNSQNVGFLHDDELLTIDLDLAARPLAEQDPVAGLPVQGMNLAVLASTPRARRDHLALLRLLLGGIGNDDAAGGFAFLLDP